MLTVPFILLVLLVFVSLVAVPCNLLAWPALAATTRLRPQARSPALLLLVAAPWLIGGGVLVSSVVDVAFGACSTGQMCLWNEDPAAVEHSRALLAAPMLLALVAVSVPLARQLLGSRRAVLALLRTALPGPEPDLRLIPTDAALAFAARSFVFLSTGMQAGLTPTQIGIVLEHERAHLQRSDGACQIAARLLSCVLIPPLRRRVLAQLTLANEAACDEAAATRYGRLPAAAAILAAERLRLTPSRMMSPAFSESFVAERVQSLLSPARRPCRTATVYLLGTAALLLIFLVGDLLYYLCMLLLFPSQLS